MKLRIIIIVPIISLTLFSCNPRQKIKLLTPHIEYETKIISPDIELDWWIQNIEGPEREKLIHSIIEKVRNGDLKVTNDNNEIISQEAINKQLEFFDTLSMSVVTGGQEIRVDSLARSSLKEDDFNKLFFREAWQMGSDPFVFRKKVFAFGPGSSKKENQDFTNGTSKPVFWIHMDTTGIYQSFKPDNEITGKIQYDVFIKSQKTGEAWYQENLVKSGRINFCSYVLEQAKSGKVSIHDCFDDKPLTSEEVKGILERVDTLTMQRIKAPYEYYDTTIVSRIEPQDIVKIRFLESWYLDWGHLLFYKKVIAIAPVVESYSEFGDFRGYRPLFWMYLKKGKD